MRVRLDTLAGALLRQEKPAEAQAQAAAALDAARLVGTPDVAWRAHHALAAASSALGDAEAALGHARQAVSLIDELRQPGAVFCHRHARGLVDDEDIAVLVN